MKHKHAKFYMETAERVAQLSTAVRLQVGCIAVKDERIISMGYNGTAPGADNTCEYTDDEGNLRTKPEVIHAEENCLGKLMRSNDSSLGCTLFLTHSPCIHCAKLVAQAQVESLVYKTDYRDDAGVNLLRSRDISVYRFEEFLKTL